MTNPYKWRGIVFMLFLSLYFYSCTRPEDNAIKPLQQYVPPPDSNHVTVSNAYTPKVDTIEISEMKFQPAEITVRKGDTVVWTNHDLVEHCVTGLNTNAWTSSELAPGSSWKMVIEKSSAYFCAIHMVMKGKIVVQ